MSRSKPIASLSLDLDNKWSYLKTHGDAAWETYPSYLGTVVPRALELLAEHGLTITFFVVGCDATRSENQAALRSIADAGHEIGNHSFAHEPWLHLYSPSRLDDEIAKAEEHLEAVTGRKPVGFRAPGYSFSPALVDVLASRGYHYDASMLPTFIGPLARAYYFASSRFTRQEAEQRKQLFGSFRDGLAPLSPHFLKSKHGDVLEIPVTTLPLFRIPIHFSYLLYISSYSRTLALAYFRFAIRMCRLFGVAPSLLLHPLDVLGREDASDLSFFPAMSLPRSAKLEVLNTALAMYREHFQVTTMFKHAASFAPGRVASPAPERVAS